MSEVSSTPATVEDKPPRIQLIWLMPLLVLAVGAYVVVQTYLNQGPSIVVQFETAEGLQAGKTQVKALNVEIGLVEEVRLAEDLSHVLVTAKLNPGTQNLLRQDTQIWVQRPRVGVSGISGFGTLLSGAYVELSPGTGATGKREFVGLESVPSTAPGVPGVRLTLYSERDNSVGAGDPVMYRGFTVGKIETSELDLETSNINYSAFIFAPYDTLITNSTRFWNASGINLKVDASGFNLQSGSLASLVAGGVAFDIGRDHKNETPVPNGTAFRLHGNERSSNTNPYRYGKLLVAMFDQSLRGLEVGAPVEYRGIRVGTVEDVLINELRKMDTQPAAVPVVFRAEPGRFGLGDSPQALQHLDERLRGSIEQGLRATLQTGNLITGSLYISLDFYPDATPEGMGEYNGYPTMPTVSTGLAQLESQVTTLLTKLNELPLQATISELNSTIASSRNVLNALNDIAADEDMQALPARLNATMIELQNVAASVAAGSELYEGASGTLQELSDTLHSVQALADKLEARPNALIFGSTSSPDPEPGTGNP
ncbi:MAG: intermembrane transport protein PqiB [Pseudomonadota bacterium]